LLLLAAQARRNASSAYNLSPRSPQPATTTTSLDFQATITPTRTYQKSHIMSSYGGYQRTGYGGTQGGDDGGFMVGSQQGSQSGGSGRNYANDSLRPVTIKQLVDCKEPYPNAELAVDGVPTTQVTLVGQVRSVAPQAVNTTYRIDDGTGIIEVKKWIDADNPEAAMALAQDTYVRVFGQLKSFNGKRHVGAHFIRPIQDFNEVNYHLLEAVYVHLQLTKGAGGNGVDADGDSMFVDGGYGGAGPDPGSDARLAPCSPDARALYNFLANAPGDGAHISQVVAGTRMEAPAVTAAAQELLNLGIIYTTDDDNTWNILEI
jgi:replication factor A2